mgnify:CR=1 FL=1
MSEQFLEYVRQQLITATLDLSGSTKGQLTALAENCLFTNERFPRRALRVRDSETGKLITVWNQPVPGKQSRARGETIVPLLPVEYSTASWRRAVNVLPDHQAAWLLWCYSEDMSYAHQEQIVQWGWQEFAATLAGKKITRKTMERLRALIWLAAQDMKNEIARRKILRYGELAALAGVSKTNWTQNYASSWEAMCKIYDNLDRASLIAVSRVRSQQKGAFRCKGLQK